MKSRNKFVCAFRGIYLGMNDRSVLIQFLCFILVNALGLYLRIDKYDFVLIWIVSAIVIVSEMFNTCVERLSDVVQPKYDERIRNIKDLSAGTVLVACIFAVMVGIVVFIKYIGG